MPTAEIHVHEGRYDAERSNRLGQAIQDALEAVLGIPSDDYFRIFHRIPSGDFVHTPGFLGMKYSKDFILLKITFIVGRPSETRLALLRELNSRIVGAVGISPDDLVINLFEIAGENVSFGCGLAQRAHIAQPSN